jgi:hypothetical protein
MDSVGSRDGRPSEGRPQGPPVVVRQKLTRLTEGRVSIVLVLDRDFSTEELSAFYRQGSIGRPAPLDYSIEGRVVRYECESEEESKWRLTFESGLAKSCRPREDRKTRDSQTRTRMGYRKLHVG